MAAGEHNHVPLVIGTNANEHDLFIPPGTVTSCTAYAQRLEQALGDELGAAVAEEYPCPSWWEAQATFSDVMSDMTFTCPSRRAARAARTGQAEPVYRYLYTHRREQGPLALVRAAHTLEIPFVFGTVGTADEPATEAELNMSRTIGRYWSRLARAGDPNGEGDVAWEACSDADCDEVLRLDDAPEMRGADATAHCDFWDAVAG
jgi:para-nitrobenzyl esterase